MPAPRLQALHDAGQSLWLDYIDRPMLHNGELERRIRDDVLTGMTSNPAIFEKALAQGTAYDAQVTALTGERTAWQLFEALASTDVRAACDRFRPVFDRTGGADGYVSLEVSPNVANDADGTVREARHLWQLVDRPNVMIKVPGTAAGCAALRQLIADGINVNVTLLFAVEAYAAVVEAYLEGLEARRAAGAPLGAVASVASFFVSRVDTEIDKRLDAKVAAGQLTAAAATSLKGKAAIANAKLAYRLFTERFSGARWDALSAQGARVQRPLWASTSTKNPTYRDVIYVEELIGPQTVNTLPPATLEAFRDHGETRRTIDVDVAEAERALAAVETAGISVHDVTNQLLAEGLAAFQKSFDTLLAGLEAKAAAMGRPVVAGR
ncbi:MAG: transaldolase [Gemmatimonadaceae bacterium]|nr:transaldolase [Gemmatimonadaceae bacterium]